MDLPLDGFAGLCFADLKAMARDYAPPSVIAKEYGRVLLSNNTTMEIAVTTISGEWLAGRSIACLRCVLYTSASI